MTPTTLSLLCFDNLFEWWFTRLPIGSQDTPSSGGGICCFATRGSGIMDGFLRALGFDSKPSYAEKIPENLEASDFDVHDVSCRIMKLKKQFTVWLLKVQLQS